MSNASDKSQASDTNEKSKNLDKLPTGGKKKRVPFGAKADFIRSMSPKLPAKEVVAAAAEVGLKITESHVYNLRSNAKQKQRKTDERRSRPKHLKPSAEPARDILRYREAPVAPIVIDAPKPAAYAMNELLAADALNHVIDNRIRQFFLNMAGAGRMANR